MKKHILRFALKLSLLAIGVTIAAPERARAEAAFHEFYRSPRALAMGNVYTALADDESAVFLNPAGLAGIKKHSIHYAILAAEFSTSILSAAGALGALSSPSGDSVNALMGKNVFTHVQITPTFLMPNLAIGLIVDQQTGLLAKNKALPNIVMAYQTTNGVQVAYGVSLTGGRRQKSDLRLGLGGKMVWRRGGYRSLSLTEMLNLNQDTLMGMIGQFGRGIGFDAGLQYVTEINPRLTLQAGMAMTEIGDIKFASTADPQVGNLSTGVALKYQMREIGITVGYDYKHMLDATDWRKRSHLGAEVRLPFISLYGGLNQMYTSYGVAFDAWLFRITAASYAEQIGTVVYQETERRYLVHAGLSFGL